MVKFLETVLRSLRPFNCFSRPTQGPEHYQQPVVVLVDRKDSLMVEDDGSNTQRTESATKPLDNSSGTGMDLFAQARSAPSIDDRITLRRTERHDDARSETLTIRPKENEHELDHIEESVGDEQGKTVARPRKTGQASGALQRLEQELEGEHVVMNDMHNGNVQKENHIDEAAAESDERSALFGTEAITIRSKPNSRSAVTPPTNRFSQASSLSLSASSWPPVDETLSPDVFAESAGASSSLSPLDAYRRQTLILGSASMPADNHNMLMVSDSPSRRQQDLLLGLEPSPQTTHTVVSVISSQAENPVPSVRLRAQLSTESLRTPSEVSVDQDWHGTILDMECKSATGGEPVYFQAKLDTFARRDAIAENIVNRLGMKWKSDPNGRTFKVLGNGADAGNVIRPLGYLALSLRVVGQQRHLTFKFYVLADSEVGRAFDCVLGCTTTMKHFLALKRENTHQEILPEDPRDE